MTEVTADVDWVRVSDPASGSLHAVQFYDRDGFLLESVERFVGRALETGESGLVIATAAHRESLDARLAARALDLAALRASGRYVALDAADTLSAITVDGWPDARRFADVIAAALARLAAVPGRRVRVFGEMVALLAGDGRPDAAARLEALWSELLEQQPFTLLCAYPVGTFRRVEDAGAFARLSGAHGHVVPAESYTALTGPAERLRRISELQQKATALETERAERREAEQALRRHRQELVDFLESAREGLQRVGPDGRVLWANRALLELLGYAAEEYVGHHVGDFHVDRDALAAMWRKLMCREAVHDWPARLRCRDGSVRHVLIHSSGFWDEGRFLHTRCFVRDVTEQRRLEAELKGRLDQLAAIDRRKDEFLAMLGHELRNPLAAVQSSLVTARLDSRRRDRALDIAHRQIDQLARLVDDILDVARITHGRIMLRIQRVGFARIVQRAVDAARPLVEERAHTLTLRLPGEDVDVEADPARLEQVIVNLLTNAAKYTEPGGRIDVTAERLGREVELRVRDSGIGIPPAMLACVFDVFAQGERTLDRHPGGLGLGLTIVRRLVELHGGRVEAHSAGPGHGAEFRVRLPAGPPARAPAASAASADAVPPAAGVEILLVEDSPDVASSLSMLLEVLGHRVRVAHDGAAGLAAARAHAPEAMLVDIGLPGMDGYEVARRARAEPALRRVVLVALTGYGRDEDRRRAASAGFDHHLIKPVEAGALQRLLAGLGPASARESRATG